MSLCLDQVRRRSPVLLLALAALAGCAGPTREGSVLRTNHFNDLNLAGRSIAATTGSHLAPSAPTETASPSEDEARTRLMAYLSAAGFQPQAERFAGGLKISGALMADPSAADHFDYDGQCPLKALERPKMSTTEVEATLTPVDPPGAAKSAGVQLQFKVRIIELDANLVSGALSKRVCPSRGVLEGALRRVAFGG